MIRLTTPVRLHKKEYPEMGKRKWASEISLTNKHKLRLLPQGRLNTEKGKNIHTGGLQLCERSKTEENTCYGSLLLWG